MTAKGPSIAVASPMHDLLAASLVWWKVPGEVVAEPDGSLLLIRPSAAANEHLWIARAPAGLPFRWQVTYAGRTRSVGSVAGVLRTVRSVVDPEFAGMTVRVGG